MRRRDKTRVEIFEWLSVEAINGALHSIAVRLWAESAAVCVHVLVATLAEAQNLFAEFEPVAL